MLRSHESCIAVAVALLFQTPLLRGQTLFRASSALDRASSAISSSLVPNDADAGFGGGQAAPSVSHHSLLNSIGVDVHAGANGIGGDIALPVADHFNLRLGGDYFKYTDSFPESGANVTASLQLGRGLAALDWFPFGNGFRISPQIAFAIQTQIRANVIVPGGQTITLDGEDFISSPANPLQGSGFVDTRKAAPGISIGWGNISPRRGGRLSFPVEIGFYYVGQPNLLVSFSGTACEAQVPASIGCQDATQNPEFQKSLNSFIVRNQHNVSYASFFPIASIGMGYRF